MRTTPVTDKLHFLMTGTIQKYIKNMGHTRACGHDFYEN